MADYADNSENDKAESIYQESFNIKNGNFEYNFYLKSDEVKLELSIIKLDETNKLIQFYKSQLNFEEIKLLHQKYSKFAYCQEFLEYIKKQKEEDNFEISDKNINLITIKLKLENIAIDIYSSKSNLENLERAINYLNEEKYNIKKSIIKENKKLNEEINELKLSNKTLKEENIQILEDLKYIKAEIEKLKKENENENLSNKNKRPENNLINLLNKNEIKSMAQIRNNKNPEKNIFKNKIIKNQYEKIIPIKNLNKDRVTSKATLKNEAKLANLKNISFEEAKNNDSFNEAMNYISNGKVYNNMTYEVIKNKKDKMNLNECKDKLNNTINADKSLIKNRSIIQYRTNNLNNEKINNNLVTNSKYSKQNENNKIMDKKYINLRNYALEIKNNNNRNIGSIIQCIFNNKKLIDYFLNNTEEIKNNKDNRILSFSLLELIESICFNKNIKESINNFKKALEIDKLLSNKNPNNNSKDFILHFIDKLHKELNKVENVNNDMNKCYDTNLNNYIQNIENYFQNNYNSIISELFYFSNLSQTYCARCNNNRDKIEINYLLMFPLEKIKEFIGKNKKIITINDCFSFYKKNKNTRQICNKCMKKDRLENNNLMIKSPKILIICLNNDDIKELDYKYKLEEKINLDDFVYYKNNCNDYELINVVYTVEDKNYIALCKSLTVNGWCLYDKQKCTQYNNIDTINKRGKPIGNPILLFYSKVEN